MEQKNESVQVDPSLVGRLVLPSEVPEQWERVEQILRQPFETLADLDTILTKFSETDREPQVCKFFKTVTSPDWTKSPEGGGENFDFSLFFEKGAPLMIQVALEMPTLFEGVQVPIFKMRSTWTTPATFNRQSFSLTRRQCACLLAHSFFGSLKKPADVLPNDWRFTVVNLFMGTAVSPNSALTFLNYFNVLAKYGIPEDESLTFERRGYKKGPSPWKWEDNPKPLCPVSIVTGNIEESNSDLQVEFANAFVGGGVMTGDAAMEETLFLVKPELMVAMAIQNRMVDEEVVCITGARKYSFTTGYGQSFAFGGEFKDYHSEVTNKKPPTTTAAIDAVRGGGPSMTEAAMLRDMNKARIAFEGAADVATGHWGCGAYGNNHDLMFLKQWLAASEADVSKLNYHEFDNKQSHHILPLLRKMKHLTVGQAWKFLQEITQDLRQPHNMTEFCKRISDISTNKLKVPTYQDK